MQIREANQSDIPQILKVLKASLGETSSKKTEEVWRYKHIDNPFGESLVLVAEEDKSIVGVRAFMRWRWQRGEEVFSAFRAVDTATHPKHQGKGIFKKLTLRALENGKKKEEDHFVFNTPNDQSKPGYLKMGWKQVGKVYVGLKPSLSFLKPKKSQLIYKIEKNISQTEVEVLCHQWNKRLVTKPGLFTPKSAEILRWRYEENPLQSYEVIADNGYYLAAYVKKRGRLKEFRIAEYIYDESKLNKVDHKKIIKQTIAKFSCHLISYSPNLLNLSAKKGNFGPMLTFNALNLSEEEIDLSLQISNWNNSLGDLELF